MISIIPSNTPNMIPEFTFSFINVKQYTQEV